MEKQFQEFESFASNEGFARQFANQYDIADDRGYLKKLDRGELQFLSELTTYGDDSVESLIGHEGGDNLVKYFSEQSDEGSGLQAVVAAMARQIEQLKTQLQEVTAKLICQQGESIPVSALPCDGTYPSGTASLEKRNIALEIPSWETDL